MVKRKFTYNIRPNMLVDYSGKSVRRLVLVVSACEGLYCLWRCLSTKLTDLPFTPRNHKEMYLSF